MVLLSWLYVITEILVGTKIKVQKSSRLLPHLCTHGQSLITVGLFDGWLISESCKN